MKPWGLFAKKENPDQKQAISEVDMLGRRIDLLTLMIDDFKSQPQKYHQVIGGPVEEAFHSLVLDRTKLEIQYLYLTKFF